MRRRVDDRRPAVAKRPFVATLVVAAILAAVPSGAGAQTAVDGSDRTGPGRPSTGQRPQFKPDPDDFRPAIARDCTSAPIQGKYPIVWRGGLVSFEANSPDYGRWMDAPVAFSQALGRVQHCWALYRQNESSGVFDGYLVIAETTFQPYGGENASWQKRSVVDANEARFTYRIRSSIEPRDTSWFDYTNSASVDEGCANADVSINAGVIGFSFPVTLCWGYDWRHMSTSLVDDHYWRSTNAGGLRWVGAAYYEKVSAGTKPTFTVTQQIPYLLVDERVDLVWGLQVKTYDPCWRANEGKGLTRAEMLASACPYQSYTHTLKAP